MNDVGEADSGDDRVGGGRKGQASSAIKERKGGTRFLLRKLSIYGTEYEEQNAKNNNKNNNNYVRRACSNQR